MSILLNKVLFAFRSISVSYNRIILCVCTLDLNRIYIGYEQMSTQT